MQKSFERKYVVQYVAWSQSFLGFARMVFQKTYNKEYKSGTIYNTQKCPKTLLLFYWQTKTLLEKNYYHLLLCSAKLKLKLTVFNDIINYVPIAID